MLDPVTLNWKACAYDPDASLDKAMRQTDWPALCRLATSLRDGVPCEPLDRATNGLNNMARLLRFEDGMLWVARVAMRRSAADTAKLQSEVATMRWIRQQSRMPVPDVFAAEADEHNPVGVPYVLMSFVPGNTAMDAGGGYETHHGVIPDAHRPRFYRSVALCHVQMTALRLPQIGTVRQTPDGAFEAGPIPGIGGPFDTATAFFAAWADQARFPRRPDEILDIMRSAPDEAKQVVRAVDTFVSRLRAVAPRLVGRSGHDRGPFPLCHPDFLHSNIIVADDADFNVLGIIDWEGACTLPWELVGFPRFLDTMPRRFGRADRYGADGQPLDEDERQRWRERREYVQMVTAWEVQEAEGTPQQGLLGVGADAGQEGTLSACLADENAQVLAYAMEAFTNGKMGFYDQLLGDLEEGLPSSDSRDGHAVP